MYTVNIQYTDILLLTIKSWKHKGLRKFFETGSTAGVNPAHRKKLRSRLALLNAAVKPEDLNLPGFKFHKLVGDRNGYYSILVSGNWRIIFQFEGQDAILIDYLDYH